MGGSTRTRSTTNSNQTQTANTTMGTTGTAMQFLPQYIDAANAAASQGAYTGDIVAGPTQVASYAPTVPNVSGFVADPGAALEDYTPDVNVRDRYIAGATDTSLGGLEDAISWAGQQGGQVRDAARDQMDYWARVSAGEFMDPNQNTALQNYLNLMSEGARDEFDRNAQRFNSEAISSGAYGGTGYGRGMAWGLDEFTENDMAQRAALLYQNYNDEHDRMAAATGGAANAFNLGLLPGQTLMGLGDAERGYNQLDINNTIARDQEIERGQAYDIEDARLRRQDTALRNQAALDNELGLANWNIFQQQNQIQDDIMRNQVDQMGRQAELTNAQSSWDAERWGDMDVWDRFFSGLGNPVFGQESSGTMTGNSTTTTSQSNPLWRDILGGLSAGAQIWGGLRGMPSSGATAGQSAGGSMQVPNFTPIQMPQIDFSRYFSQWAQGGHSNPAGAPGASSSVPWYLTPMYNPGG